MKWSFKKTVAGFLAVVFFAVGIFFAYGAIRWHWDNKKAEQEVYWQTPVDLSRKGSLLIAPGLGILFYCLLIKRDVVSTTG